MLQQARNLGMDLDGGVQQPRFLMHDRKAKFNHAFDAFFGGEVVHVIRTRSCRPRDSRGAT